MTKYLLSDGKLTTDLVEYAIDYIRTYLIIKYNDIPYSSFGNSMDFLVNKRSEVIYQISKGISTAVSKLNSDYPSLNAVLEDTKFEDRNISAVIKMNNEIINLSLSV